MPISGMSTSSRISPTSDFALTSAFKVPVRIYSVAYGLLCPDSIADQI